MNERILRPTQRLHLILAAACLAAGALIAVGTSSHASVVLAMELPEITAQADAIVVAKVIGTQSRQQRDSRAILTEVTLQVQESWKGKLTSHTISIMQPGGVVGDLEMRVHGLPSFAEGEQAVLFLNERVAQQPALGFVLTGLGQGKRRLFRDPTGRLMAAPSDRSAAVSKSQTGQWAPAPQEATTSLDDLRQQVRLLVGGLR